MLEKKNINSHVFLAGKTGSSSCKLNVLLLSDVHWDNPKCDRKKLKKDLDYAMERDAIILINGDLFCLMQGKFDPRRSKSDIRAEHNSTTYLDDVVDDAIKWFMPYKDNIKLIGRGNHEQAILKTQETDVLVRFAKGLGIESTVGGYGGFFHIDFCKRSNFVIHYYHGAGGGGAVSKGVPHFHKRKAIVQGVDAIWMGHTHDSYEAVSVVQEYNPVKKESKLKNIYDIRTSTYKEEYDKGANGFIIEKLSSPPKHIGGRFIEFKFSRKNGVTLKSYIP
jgi:hypothetical protein